MNRILVGLDPSPSGRAALQWAAQQARLTARQLVAINAVPIPPSLAPLGVIAMPEPPKPRAMPDSDRARRESPSLFRANRAIKGWDSGLTVLPVSLHTRRSSGPTSVGNRGCD
jgi:nucleotide-binding universal stress UspA family protein